jgi:hypothetical protein
MHPNLFQEPSRPYCQFRYLGSTDSDLRTIRRALEPERMLGEPPHTACSCSTLAPDGGITTSDWKPSLSPYNRGVAGELGYTIGTRAFPQSEMKYKPNRSVRLIPELGHETRDSNCQDALPNV